MRTLHAPAAMAVPLLALSLAGCGSNQPDDAEVPTQPRYARQITFGDSLSDVGTYAVGTIAQAGGGRFTINGDSTARDPALTGKVWVEVLAGQLGLAAPCAAQTGLLGRADQGFAVPVQERPGCFNYAMGGARVTDPVGPGNAAAGAPLGALTIPVTAQVEQHLARSGGKFDADDIVFVMAGGNDALTLLRSIRASASAAASKAGAAEGSRVAAQTFAGTLAASLGGSAADPAGATQRIAAAIEAEAARAGSNDDSVVAAAVATAAAQAGNGVVASPRVFQPLVVKARLAAKAAADSAAQAAGRTAAEEVFAANAATVVARMATAGTELAAIVNDRIVGRGAARVVVINLPDLGSTPGIRPLDAPVRQLVDGMVDAFNGALAARIAGSGAILHVDIRTLSREHVLHPERFGLTNTSDTACGPNLLERNSLVCTFGNLVAGNVAHYMFADDVHPTPFEHTLIAQHVAERMVQRGWIGRERAALAWGPSAPPACRANRLEDIEPEDRPSAESMRAHPEKSCEPV